jgi:two-component system response regulator AlgR
LKCLVVDDEALARQRLVRLLQDLQDWQVCAQAADGRTALDLSIELQPEVVLLDIRMPGMDGLEAARHLALLEKQPAVIFTTAYGDHALEAFEAQAIDYLLKPIHPERLQQALEKAHRLGAAQLRGLRESDLGNRARTHLCARNRGNLELIPLDEVLYLQADHKYVTVCSASRQILIEESLKSLEQEFPDRFLRIHRNALIAPQALRGLEKNQAGHTCAVLEGTDSRLEISRRLLPEIRKRVRQGQAPRR